MTDTPEIGSVWQHYNGLHFQVLHIANEHTAHPDKYPVQVVYQGVHNGRVWVRTLVDWHRSFTIKLTVTKGE